MAFGAQLFGKCDRAVDARGGILGVNGHREGSALSGAPARGDVTIRLSNIFQNFIPAFPRFAT